MPVSQDNSGGFDAGQSMGGVAHKVGKARRPTSPPPTVLNVGGDFDVLVGCNKKECWNDFCFLQVLHPHLRLNPCSNSEKNTERTSIYRAT